MKIATLGSCQLMALNWYLMQLFPKYKSKWVSPEIFQFWSEKSEYTSTNSIWKSQVNHNIFDSNDGINYLKSADCIIYQKIKPTTSELFNYEKIDSYAKPSAKLVSLTYIHYDKNSNDPLKGMIEREELLIPDIKISKLISENPNREHFKFNQKGTHCNSVVFLEILREVCEKLEWSFFNEDKYKEIKEQYYPFGENL
jgi:hypothetical protein